MNASEEKAFQSIYRHYYASHRVTVANPVIPDYGECDVLSVSKAGLVYEFEIKNSRSDFLSEMRSKQDKHAKFMAGAGPNYFYFVTTDIDIIKPIDLPSKFGVIELGRGGSGWHPPRIKAKRAHDEKISFDLLEILANRLTRRTYGTLDEHLATRWMAK